MEGRSLIQRITVAIYIANIMGGGTYRHAKELVNAWRTENKRVLLVQVWNPLIKVTVYDIDAEEKNFFLYGEDETSRLAQILRSYQTTILHVEHMLNAPYQAFHLHQMVGCRLAVTLHDYFSICPFIKLVDENDTYCEECGCNQCLKERKFYSETFQKNVVDIEEWRQFWQSYLVEADKVMVPSIDMQMRMKHYFPDLDIQMVENPEMISCHSKIRRIGLVGSLSVEKGAKKIKETLSYCSDHHLPIRFVLFGTLLEVSLTKQEKEYIQILGPYQEEEVYQQIRSQAIDFFWFPGVLPETYSYTLSIPIRLQISCISTDLGAIASRIQSNHWGTTYSWKSDAKAICHELMNFDFESYANPNFVIRNTSFGNFESYYGIMKKRLFGYPDIPVLKHVQVVRFTFRKLMNQIEGFSLRNEFWILWKQADIFQKLVLIRHIDYKYYYKKIKENGIGRSIDTIKEKVRQYF